MKRFYRILNPTVFFAIILSFLIIYIANKAHEPVYYHQNLFDSIEYSETPLSYDIGYLKTHPESFKPLTYPANKNFSRLITNKNNVIWLKIDFEVSPILKRKSLGLYIGRLRSSAELYLNDIFIGKYGDNPPTEMTSGYVSQVYMFTNKDINMEGKNTIYIKVWPGPRGSISQNVFLSDQEEVFNKAERKTFFNSRIIISFSAISLFISFLYFVLYFILRKHNENRTYLLYALANLYTSHFLLAFFISEISWITPLFVSYFGVVKFTFCFGGFCTFYFANSFIISYIGHEATKKEMIIRLALLALPILISCSLSDYQIFFKILPLLILLVLSQFLFSIPLLIKNLMDKENRHKGLKLLQGFTPVLVSVVLDFIIHIIFQLDDEPFITLYGWQVTIYIFLCQLLFQFGNMYIYNSNLKSQLEDFNTNLEDIVTIRTQELSKANYVLSRGLETISHVQKNFLPPLKNYFKGWEISIFYQPLDNDVSGDLYDYYNTSSSLDGLGIFDVSGHGIPAGLMTILAKGIISQHFLNGLKQDESISAILEQINYTYIREKVNVENYITGLLFHFSDFNKNDICSVEFANAGHPYPLLYSTEKDQVIELKNDNPDEQYGIIGVEGLDVSFPPVSFRMAKNDFIICFTDGLTEAKNEQREEYTKERVIKIAEKYKQSSSSEILNYIISDLKQFTGNKPTDDDITLIILKRTGSNDYIEEI